MRNAAVPAAGPAASPPPIWHYLSGSLYTMVKKLTRTGRNVITPKRSSTRARKFRKAMAKVNRKYAGLFKRLSES